MLDLLSRLSKEAFVVYLVLQARVTEKPKKMGLTAMELSRLANIGVNAVDIAVEELVEKGLVEYSTNKLILEGGVIPYSKQNTDSERLRKLEQECQRLRGVVATWQRSSGLHQIAPEYERDCIRKTEELYGRGLTVDEAFLLGGMLKEFGSTRTYGMIQKNIGAQNPIRAAAGAMKNGAAGTKFKKPELNEPRIKSVSLDELRG